MNDDRRESRRKFQSDVAYEAWRRGLDPDRAADCARDCYYDGRTPDECVDGLEDRIRRARRRDEDRP